MLDGFAAHTHGLRVLIEPHLRGLDDVFVFPAFDAALVGGYTSPSLASMSCSRT